MSAEGADDVEALQDGDAFVIQRVGSAEAWLSATVTVDLEASR